MKKLLICISILALAACSSAPKDEEPAPESTPAASEQPADASADAATADKSADSGNSMSMDSGSNMDGGFPDVEGTERSGATCKNGGDERLVSVIDTREGPCGVVYTKGGNKATVAYAKHDMGFCDKVFDNIVGNLSGGGFDCGGAGNTAKAAPADNGGGDAAAETSEEAPAESGDEQKEGE